MAAAPGLGIWASFSQEVIAAGAFGSTEISASIYRGDIQFASRTDPRESPSWSLRRTTYSDGYTYAEEFDSTTWGFANKSRVLHYRCGTPIHTRALLVPIHAVIVMCLSAAMLPLLCAVLLKQVRATGPEPHQSRRDTLR